MMMIPLMMVPPDGLYTTCCIRSEACTRSAGGSPAGSPKNPPALMQPTSRAAVPQAPAKHLKEQPVPVNPQPERADTGIVPQRNFTRRDAVTVTLKPVDRGRA